MSSASAAVPNEAQKQPSHRAETKKSTGDSQHQFRRRQNADKTTNGSAKSSNSKKSKKMPQQSKSPNVSQKRKYKAQSPPVKRTKPVEAKKDVGNKKGGDKKKNRNGPKPANEMDENEFFEALRRMVHLPPRIEPLPILTWRIKSDLSWNNLETENVLLPFLLKYGRKERGGLFRHPQHRVNFICRKCKEQEMPMSAAASLRRHWILKHARGNFAEAGLGSNENIRKAAHLTEVAVKEVIQEANITFLSEKEQKTFANERRQSPEDPAFVPTPDFLFKQVVLLKLFSTGGLSRDYPIHWLEVKMFYGAASLPWDNGAGAVGCLQKTATKYTRLFGTGAIFFLYGCSQELANKLADLGVVVLDNSADVVDHGPVQAHQQTWCADNHGRILP